MNMQDGSRSIFLSTEGMNENEVPKEMVKFLKFVKADLEESTQDFEDEFVESLQRSVRNVKENREMEERFMILHEMLRDERAEGKMEGKAESVLILLEKFGVIPENIRERIMSETDLDELKRWLGLAALADSMEQFLKDM